jgi:hypothetical protein
MLVNILPENYENFVKHKRNHKVLYEDVKCNNVDQYSVMLLNSNLVVHCQFLFVCCDFAFAFVT